MGCPDGKQVLLVTREPQGTLTGCRVGGMGGSSGILLASIGVSFIVITNVDEI